MKITEDNSLNEQWWSADITDSNNNTRTIYMSSSNDISVATSDFKEIVLGKNNSSRTHEKPNPNFVPIDKNSTISNVVAVDEFAVKKAPISDRVHLTDRQTRRTINGLFYGIGTHSSFTDKLISQLKTMTKGKSVYIHHIDGDEANNDPDNIVAFLYKDKAIANGIHSIIHRAGVNITNVPNSYHIADAILINNGVATECKVYIDIVV